MIDKNWMKAHAEEEIEGAKTYFAAAQNCDEDCMKDLIEMGQQELHHAGMLYGMMAEM